MGMTVNKETPWYIRIATLRAQTGKKQIQICNENGFDKKEYSLWERGMRMPRRYNKARIADCFGVAVTDIWD